MHAPPFSPPRTSPLVPVPPTNPWGGRAALPGFQRLQTECHWVRSVAFEAASDATVAPLAPAVRQALRLRLEALLTALGARREASRPTASAEPDQILGGASFENFVDEGPGWRIVNAQCSDEGELHEQAERLVNGPSLRGSSTSADGPHDLRNCWRVSPSIRCAVREHGTPQVRFADMGQAATAGELFQHHTSALHYAPFTCLANAVPLESHSHHHVDAAMAGMMALIVGADRWFELIMRFPRMKRGTIRSARMPGMCPKVRSPGSSTSCKASRRS